MAVAAGPLITLVYRLKRAEDAQMGTFSMAQGVRGLLCLAMFVSLGRARRLCLLEHPLIKPLMLLAGYSLVTAVLSPYPYENISFAVKLAFGGFVFASAFHLSERQSLGERWLTGCAWTILLLMVMSQIAGFMMGSTLNVYHSTSGTAGLMDQAAVAAVYSISAMPIMLARFPDRRSSLVAIGAMLGCVFFTMRRTELIAAVMALGSVVCFAASSGRRRVAWSKIAVAVVAIGALAVVMLNSPTGEDFVARIRDLDPSGGTGSGRYVFWRIGLDHAIGRGLDAQILGDGVGVVRDVIGQEYGLAIGCHNDWLDVMNSFGFVGLALFGWWFLGLLRFVIVMHQIDHPAFQGGLALLVMVSMASFGSGGTLDPCYVAVYAALGFWAGQPLWSESYEYAQCAAY